MEQIDGLVLLWCCKRRNKRVDNTWSLKSHLTRKLNVLPKDADAFLEIPEDFDNVELPELLKK